MNSQNFNKSYELLNSAQREAVDSVEGPVMVIAGPGTGKTQILTLRIANILKKTDTNPHNILALTFTESGVVSMRRRLAEIIGSAAYSVNISTFHGFCNEIIKSYPEKFPRIIGSENITEADQLRVIEEVISATDLKILRPFGDPMLYVRDIVARINDVKREGVLPERLKEILLKEKDLLESASDLYHEKGAHKGKMKGMYIKELAQLEKALEFAKVYELYEERLTKEKLYDYSDMLVEALRAMDNDEDLLLTLQEEFQYILVDEHQDTNNAQNRIMELLASFHKNPNIFIVGDEKQAIFRFQGASLENFFYFRNLYPEAKIVVLENNYRSTQPILDSAHSVLAGEKRLIAKKSVDKDHEETKIKLYPFKRKNAGDYFLANDIKELIDSGVNPSEVAIIYHDNKDAESISIALEKAGVQYAIESEENVLMDPGIRKVMLLLKAVYNFGEPGSFINAMHIDFVGVLPLDIYKLARYSADKKIEVVDLAKSIRLLSKINLDNPEAIHNFYNQLSNWARYSRNKGLTEFFEILINESGALKNILNHDDPFGKMDKLNAVYDVVKDLAERNKLAGLGDLMDYFDILERHKRSISKSVVHHISDKVRLMTAHRSKGQEFEHVYIVNCEHGHWGDRRRIERLKLPDAVYSLTGKVIKESVDDGDERRLFYVALTRAKKSVSIIYSRDGGTKGEALPSRFIEELDDDLVLRTNTEVYEENYDKHHDVAFAPRKTKGHGLKDKEFIHELFERKGLSVTDLNNYMDCPWKYFYTNLIRVPKAKEKYQMYGIAVHAALNDLLSGKAISKKSKPTKAYLLKAFKEHLAEEPLSSANYNELLDKGNKALSGYYDENKNKWENVLKTEFSIRGILLTDEIKLTGNIDRIDLVGNKDEVNVIDYKTSQFKTRGEIEGKTKNSDGGIKRQLVFYKILLNRLEGPKYKMISGQIDFTEPDAKGKYHKEVFYINDDEVSELEELIKEKVAEIMDLKFWNERCNKKECEFCALRDLV